MARARFARAFDFAFRDIDDISAHLSAAYRSALLAELRPYWSVRLTVARTWPGYSGGFPEINIRN